MADHLPTSPMQPRVLRWFATATLCAAASAAPAAEYTVVVLQSLTGGASFIGSPLKDGMVLAAEDINRKQELGAGNTLKVLVADDATDRAQTITLLTRYTHDPSVLMVLGPTSGAVAPAAANAVNDLKLPILATSNSLDVLKAGPWANILTQPATVTIPHIANYAADKIKVKNCTIVGLSDNESYVSLQKGFESAAKAKGVNIRGTELFKGGDSDFSAMATKVAANEKECIFLSASAPQAANIIIQLRQAGLHANTRIIGHTSLASPQFVQIGGKAVEGTILMGDWVPGGSTDLGREFAASYKARYKTDADNWAAIGYGGMRVAAAAIKAAGPNPTREAVRNALGKTSNVQVVVGAGTFSVDAERIPRIGMNILTVQGGRFVAAP